MNPMLLLVLIGACLAGCAAAPVDNTATTADSIDHLNPPRIKVPVPARDEHIAKAKALAGLEGDGWVFDPLYATAVNAAGSDLAVCGFAHQRGTRNAVYFAYYSGELLVSDDKASAGLSVENQFLTLVCSHS